MQKKTVRGPKTKGALDKHTEHLAVMLRPRDRVLLERLADGEPVSAYARRVLRGHLAEQLGATPAGTQS
jgi:hypothetical protein